MKIAGNPKTKLRSVMNKSREAQYPRARSDNERLHACASVVALLLAKARVNHIYDAVYGQRCLRNVGSYDNLEKGKDT